MYAHEPQSQKKGSLFSPHVPVFITVTKIIVNRIDARKRAIAFVSRILLGIRLVAKKVLSFECGLRLDRGCTIPTTFKLPRLIPRRLLRRSHFRQRRRVRGKM